MLRSAGPASMDDEGCSLVGHQGKGNSAAAPLPQAQLSMVEATEEL